MRTLGLYFVLIQKKTSKLLSQTRKEALIRRREMLCVGRSRSFLQNSWISTAVIVGEELEEVRNGRRFGLKTNYVENDESLFQTFLSK